MPSSPSYNAPIDRQFPATPSSVPLLAGVDGFGSSKVENWGTGFQPTHRMQPSGLSPVLSFSSGALVRTDLSDTLSLGEVA